MSDGINQSLIIRADANARIGTGHFMRCLALVQAWKDAGGEVDFITTCSNDQLLQRLYDEGFEVHRLEYPYPHVQDWQMTGRILSEHAEAWLVLDGYHFDSEYYKCVKEAGYRLLVIDDTAHLPHYYANIVLNQNIHAKSLEYSCEPYTKLLLGTKYVLLRREFLKWEGRNREIPDVASKVLVTLGGGDPENVTLKVFQALRGVNANQIEVVVVIGPTNPHLETIQNELSHVPFAYRLLPSVRDMPELMAWADVAVSAGGSTCWELAFMGVPNVILFFAENQRAVAENLNGVGVAVNLGWSEKVTSDKIAQALQQMMLDKEVRAKMSGKGQELVDGRGSERVVNSTMLDRLTLRPVQEKDCELIWKWANDPDVRAVSFSSGPIPWNDHVRWFKSKLNDPSCFFYVAINKNGIPVGQARFDKNENENVISVIVDDKFRGHGYGSMVIESASQKFFEVSSAQEINAYIKQGNEASKRAFVSAGFRYVGITTSGGESMIRLRLQRNNRV